MSADDLGPYLELDGICRHPVFIVGSPRSGTTALGHALGRHPELWTSKESYVLHQLYGEGRAGRVWKHHWERKTPSWLRAEEVERAEFLGFLGLGLNALYSSRSGGRRWVDPTPLNTPMVDDLADMFPGASFLHLVRDGRFVVRSMGSFRQMLEGRHGAVSGREVPAWTEDFHQACRTWADYVATASRFAEASPGRCLEIRNEELVADPRAGFARLYDFLGVDADDAPAAFFSGTRINSSFQRAANRPGDADWGAWGPERRREFAELAGPTLVAAGYASAGELEEWATSGLIAAGSASEGN